MPNQFTIYRSTDTSAPVLTGQTGSLITLLDACLVNGYGSKTAAGWGKAFSGTSKAAYRAASGSRLYYRIQDDGPGAGTFKEARIRGYEVMTDVDTGTGLFPTTTQAANGQFIRKSATADSTARTWIVIADARTVYLFVLTGDVANTYFTANFGEFYSFVANDAYNGYVMARFTENSAAGNVERLDLLDVALAGGNTVVTYCPRGHTGLGSCVILSKHGDGAKGNSTSLIGEIPFTNPADGGLYMSPVWFADPTTAPVNGIRGRQRGFWHFLHVAASVSDGDTVSGTGGLAGKTFLFIKSGGNSGVYTIETSATLDTN